MKKQIKLFSAAILLGAILLGFAACDEDEVLNLSGIQYFLVEFKPVNPPGVDLESIRPDLENPSGTLPQGAIEFNNLNPDDDPLLTAAANDVTITGDPETNLSQTDIYITAKPAEAKAWAKHVRIVVNGKIELGKVFTNDPANQNYAEMVFVESGTDVYSTRVGDDTYFELTITEFNKTTRQIEGEFFFALRHEGNPASTDPIVGFGGEFRYTYRVP